MNVIKVQVKRKGEQQTQPRANISVETSEKGRDTYAQTVEIREKRIGIVFKVIYVVAIFFAAMFMTLSAGAGKGLTDLYIMEAAAATLLLVVLIYMVMYIINEMKCLKLYESDLPKKQIELTENSYSQIFMSWRTSGFMALLSVAVISQIKDWLKADYVAGAFIGFFVLFMILFCVTSFVKGIKNKVFWIFQCALGTGMLICVLLLPAFAANVN